MIKLKRNNDEALAHFKIVKPLIETRINKVLNRGYITYKSNKQNLNDTIRYYLNDLLINNNLENLICASPENLPNIISGIRNFYPNFIVEKSLENLILRNVFISGVYDNKDFSKLDVIKRINIDTCPYCNRNYIYYLSKSSEIKPQIDHFYPKSTYPFLAISYYNLIPSCQTCNGFGAKEEKDPLTEDLVNPYLIENNNFKFGYEINHINFLNPLLDKTSVYVGFIHQLDGHVTVFKLNKLYQQHSDHVLELIIKSKVAYSEKYRDYLNSYDGLKFSEHEIDRMILGNYSKEEENHKRPLAKLYQDIGIELGLIIKK